MLVRLNQDLQNPNICTICEEKPLGDTVIDCERYTPNSPRYRLNGRKYVCQNCANEIAKKSGYVSIEEVEKLREDLINTMNYVDSLKEKLTQYEDLRTLITSVATEPFKKSVGRPKKVVTPDVSTA